MVAWDRTEENFLKFQGLPDEVRKFVLSPLNLGYLHVAMHLSEMPAERLRAIAESLLDITY
jgi:hypothetical protein